jgi:hypothetical protein
MSEASSAERVARTAQAVLAGERSLTELARELDALRHEVGAEWSSDFLVFTGIASETDNFPVGKLREQWHPETLPALDAEREAYEACVYAVAREAAEALIKRYGSSRAQPSVPLDVPAAASRRQGRE